MLRRVKGRVQQVLAHGNIMLNETAKSVTVNGKPVDLSQGANRSAVNVHASSQPGAHPANQLISLTFNNEFQGFDRAIDSQIARLRKQISRDGGQPIQTVYGAGYKFVVEGE